MKTLVYGSLNIDHVYRLPHFLRPGETLPSEKYSRGSGGKGLNQAIALARAGMDTWFAGGLGQDGLFLKEALEGDNVNTSLLKMADVPTGHAIICVNDEGENAILLYGGANQTVTEEDILRTLDACAPGDAVLLQNEINLVPEIILRAKERGLTVVLNPSPASPDMANWPLHMVDWLILNEVEGFDLTGQRDPDAIADALLIRCPAMHVVLTLGPEGSLYADATSRLRQQAMPVDAVDTTAAGDTFTGYLMQGIFSGMKPAEALRRASCGAAMAVERPGASASIPARAEVEKRLAQWTEGN
ncbi:MAG: ribokinase [Clostridiales bacterium]|nr:ribokinase [Clostridiales bacterium]